MKGRGARIATAAVLALTLGAAGVRAQEDPDSTQAGFGAYEPNNGFKVASTDQGEIGLRIYTYVRYLNQTGLDDSYTDSFGTTSAIDQRQDIQLQKVTINFQGWVMSPKLRYLFYVWTSNTNQGLDASVVVGGNVQYAFAPRLTVGAGIDALPGVRATEGNFPFWLTTDNRLMADEFFRPSYTMGVWARGQVVERLSYRLMLGNNLSQLGVDAGQLDDQLSTVAAALIWLPTTGEFGTRGGFGDFDRHERVATRVAAHFTRSDEDRQSQPTSAAFENVTIRLSDGNPIFKDELFGPGVRVEKAAYQMFCADGGVKYRGFALEGEYYRRWVNDLRGLGLESLGFDELDDDGFQLQASGMAIPQALQAYAGYSQVFGGYGDPWDLRVGLNWFPWRNQVVRWNLEYLHTDRSPVGGLSLPTVVGGTGDTFYTTFQVNF